MARIIGELNDLLRVHRAMGRVDYSQGIRDLGSASIRRIRRQIADYDAFDPDDDPDGLRAAGNLVVDGLEVAWRIESFDPEDSKEPADPADFWALRIMSVRLLEANQ